MLSANEVRLIRKAVGLMAGPEASYAACLLRVVLEEEDTPPPPPPPIASLDKTPEQKLIADLEVALAATRERAEQAELRLLEEVRKRG